jgi:hypothetical protein
MIRAQALQADKKCFYYRFLYSLLKPFSLKNNLLSFFFLRPQPGQGFTFFCRKKSKQKERRQN